MAMVGWPGGSEPQPGKSVLLVEDDDLLRGAMKMVLQWEGYRVACARDGREALDLLRTAGPPSLILLGVMMPVLDGREFRQEQQQDPALADIPVVVVSGTDAREWPDASGHVRKPFQPEELLAAIRGVR
jgi:CheY-like chemotaxis protein